MVNSTLADRTAFVNEGYAVVRDVLPVDVVAEMGAFLAAEEVSAVALLREYLQLSAADDLCAAAEAMLQRDDRSLPKGVRDVAMGHHLLTTRLSERLWTVTRIEAFRALVETLVGSEHPFMHLPPASRFVLPGSRTAAVPAHQDRSYNMHLPQFVTVWVPLVPIDDRCGGVTVYTGGDESWRALAQQSGPWLGACSTSGLRPVQPHFELGDVLVLSEWVVHQSAPNRSEGTRRSIDYRFFGAGRSKKHALDLNSYEVLAPEETR
jgi:hypothetical protein